MILWHHTTYNIPVAICQAQLCRFLDNGTAVCYFAVMDNVQQIRRWQKERGLHDAEVAKALGISRQWWSYIKNGHPLKAKAEARLANRAIVAGVEGGLLWRVRQFFSEKRGSLFPRG